MQSPFKKPFVFTADSDSYQTADPAVTEVTAGQHCGAFGAVRKHHIHEGVDLYCDNLQPVYPMEPGVVVAVGNFTGPDAGSPWWNNTQYVTVKGEHGHILYGEINAFVAVGETVCCDTLLGQVIPVLKKCKGRPMSMLHLEHYSKWLGQPVIGHLDQSLPDYLLNPANLFQSIAQENNQW